MDPVGGITLASLIQVIRDAGSIGLMALFVWGGLTRRVVWGWQYDELMRDREEWRALALRGTALAERSVPKVERDG